LYLHFFGIAERYQCDFVDKQTGDFGVCFYVLKLCHAKADSIYL